MRSLARGNRGMRKAVAIGALDAPPQTKLVSY
jgi:hypothetical protein